MSVKKIVRRIRKILPSAVVRVLDAIAFATAFACLVIVITMPVSFSFAVATVVVGFLALTWRIFSDSLPPLW